MFLSNVKLLNMQRNIKQQWQHKSVMAYVNIHVGCLGFRNCIKIPPKPNLSLGKLLIYHIVRMTQLLLFIY